MGHKSITVLFFIFPFYAFHYVYVYKFVSVFLHFYIHMSKMKPSHSWLIAEKVVRLIIIVLFLNHMKLQAKEMSVFIHCY